MRSLSIDVLSVVRGPRLCSAIKMRELAIIVCNGNTILTNRRTAKHEGGSSTIFFPATYDHFLQLFYLNPFAAGWEHDNAAVWLFDVARPRPGPRGGEHLRRIGRFDLKGDDGGWWRSCFWRIICSCRLLLIEPTTGDVTTHACDKRYTGSTLFLHSRRFFCK